MVTMSQAIKEAFGKSGGALSREAIKAQERADWVAASHVILPPKRGEA